MRAEFYKSEDPGTVVGAATWTGDRVHAASEHESVREALGRIFRPTAVKVDDPALRSFGTSGPTLLAPGTLRWFRAAATSRAGAEGLAVRLVPQGANAMGWDPAGAYRTFVNAVERKELIGVAGPSTGREAGEARPEGERGPSEPGTEAAKPGPRPSAAGPAPA